MLDFSAAILDKIAIHHVGNKQEEGGVRFSTSLYHPREERIKESLFKFFTSHFKSSEFYNFSHSGDINLNEVYTYADHIFTDPNSLFDQSISLAKHLYEQSTHPKVKAGEFYVVYFRNCVVEGEMVDAIGLFKTESRDTYLKVYPKDDNYGIDLEDGININKLDKGAMIFNYEKEKGYLVAIVDNFSKGNEAQYWMDDFLHIKHREDEYHNTQNVLNLCKDFVLEKLPEDFEISKADQADLLNRSIKFFREKDKFNLDEFSDVVVNQPDLIESFRDYKGQYQNERQLRIDDEFDISSPAVKKQGRFFRSIIKLDKNFHIYVHGDRQLIECGKDETTGMKYYKLYYKDEN